MSSTVVTQSGINATIYSNYCRVGKWSARTIQQRTVGRLLEILDDRVWEFEVITNKRSKFLKKAIIESSDGICFASVKTIRRWFRHYLMYGEVPEDTRRRQSLRTRRGFRRATSFTQEDSDALLNIIESSPHLYLDEIQDIMSTQCGKVWHPVTLWRQMKHLGYSLQVATKRAKQQDEGERLLYKEVFEEVVDTNNLQQLIYLDETHRSQNASRRRRHWSKRGVTPVSLEPFFGRFDARFTMIGACDINGFVKSTCDVIEREHGGSRETDPTRGTVNQNRFELWISEFLAPVLGNFVNGEPRSIVILDNASIHHSKRVVELIEATGAKILFLPPYSPDLNPIELKFNLYKANMRRNSDVHWIEAHLLGLEAVTPKHARGCFRRCLNKLGVAHPLIKEDDDGKELVETEESNLESHFFTIACLFDPIPLILALEYI
jgi:transposase